MKTKMLKRLVWALPLLFCLSATWLPAQILGPYGTSPITFGVDAHGLLTDTGTFGGGGSLSLSGAGARMIWYPSKAAFRAGYVDGTQWDDVNIGPYSTAFGYDAEASGWSSVAIGYNANALQTCAIAIGNGSVASTNSNATAIGLQCTATGLASLALGYNNTAAASFSVDIGAYSAIDPAATGSLALGYGSKVTGIYAAAVGSNAQATGPESAAIGFQSNAVGQFSTTLGAFTSATAYDSTVAGSYNVGGGNSTTWVATDPLFEVGMGTDPYHPLDALMVDKSGDVTAHGTMRCSPGGDLSMGSFLAGTHP